MKTESCYAWPRDIHDRILCSVDIFCGCLWLFYVANPQTFCAIAVSVWSVASGSCLCQITCCFKVELPRSHLMAQVHQTYHAQQSPSVTV